jgi:hypothetical protein
MDDHTEDTFGEDVDGGILVDFEPKGLKCEKLQSTRRMRRRKHSRPHMTMEGRL